MSSGYFDSANQYNHFEYSNWIDNSMGFLYFVQWYLPFNYQSFLHFHTSDCQFPSQLIINMDHFVWKIVGHPSIFSTNKKIEAILMDEPTFSVILLRLQWKDVFICSLFLLYSLNWQLSSDTKNLTNPNYLSIVAMDNDVWK